MIQYHRAVPIFHPLLSLSRLHSKLRKTSPLQQTPSNSSAPSSQFPTPLHIRSKKSPRPCVPARKRTEPKPSIAPSPPKPPCSRKTCRYLLALSSKCFLPQKTRPAALLFAIRQSLLDEIQILGNPINVQCGVISMQMIKTGFIQFYAVLFLISPIS